MKRCSKCDKSDHTHCKRGECECLCQEYPELGNMKQRDEPSKMYSDSENQFFEDMNKEWKEIQDRNKPRKK